MKIINQDQLNSILGLLERYNVGVKDYSAVVKLFNELPIKEIENKQNETKQDDTKTEQVA